jgi:hypothetical protein
LYRTSNSLGVDAIIFDGVSCSVNPAPKPTSFTCSDSESSSTPRDDDRAGDDDAALKTCASDLAVSYRQSDVALSTIREVRTESSIVMHRDGEAEEEEEEEDDDVEVATAAAVGE